MQVASVTSSNQPLPDQDARSSASFKFLRGNGRIRVQFVTENQDPQDILCDLSQDWGEGDPRVANLYDGARFKGNRVDPGGTYYIASPTGATEDFIVVFYDEAR